MESLRSAAKYAVGFINARGAMPVVRLYDVPNHVREVALHGVRHGAAMALAIAQACSSHELRLLCDRTTQFIQDQVWLSSLTH